MTEEEVRTDCARVTEAMQMLRWGPVAGTGEAFTVPPFDAPPPEVNEFLRELRARLDLAEKVMTEMGRLRARADLAARKARAACEDAYDGALAPVSERAVRREYESIRDREVQARVKSSADRRAQQAAERLAEFVAAADKEVRQAFFGLRDIREETLVRLRNYLPWEASLER